MIGPLIESVRPRVEAADAVSKTDERLGVTLSRSRGEQVIRSVDEWCQLRVVRDGRLGQAGAASRAEWESLPARAVESAALASAARLHLPAPAPVPQVSASHQAAFAAGTEDAIQLARLLVDRLHRDDREVETWVERSGGRVEVANSRGLLVGYEATLVGLGARIASRRETHGPVLELSHVGVEWPGLSDLEALVQEADRRLEPPLLADSIPPTSHRVCLGPGVAARLIRVLAVGLVADSLFSPRSPLGGRMGEPILPDCITLVDDPLAARRPGSRPTDDEGVVSRPVTLIDRGRLTGWIADLGTGIRFEVPSTGHGRRWPFAPTRPAFSNLVLAPGAEDWPGLLAATGDGVLVLDLPPLRSPLADGQVVAATDWAYRVNGGEVVGRLPRLVIRGSLLAMLKRLVALGREVQWQGSWSGPAMVLDGIELAPG